MVLFGVVLCGFLQASPNKNISPKTVTNNLSYPSFVEYGKKISKDCEEYDCDDEEFYDAQSDDDLLIPIFRTSA